MYDLLVELRPIGGGMTDQLVEIEPIGGDMTGGVMNDWWRCSRLVCVSLSVPVCVSVCAHVLSSAHTRQALPRTCNPHKHRQAMSVLHTFSAFRLRSSVVSVLVSVTTDMSPTGDLLVAFICLREGALSSLLRGPCALHWHRTLPGAAHP
jgi:hypothetical protein